MWILLILVSDMSSLLVGRLFVGLSFTFPVCELVVTSLPVLLLV